MVPSSDSDPMTTETAEMFRRQRDVSVGENHRLRAALRSIYALPCAYPDDPNEDRKLAARFAEAQDIAHEVLTDASL